MNFWQLSSLAGKRCFVCRPGNLFILISFSIALILCGCSKESSENEESSIDGAKSAADSLAVLAREGAVDVDKMTDEEKLLIYKIIPKRISYQETKAIFPGMGELKTEGDGTMEPKYGLYESNLSLSVLGRQARLEFNYENDSLYAYYFFISNVDSLAAEQIYIELRNFYELRFGAYAEERETRQYIYESCFWESDTLNFGISKSIYTKDNAIIGWGFQ